MLHIPQAQTRATITPMVASVNQDIDITDYTTAKLAEGFQALGLANTAIRGVAAAIVDAGDAPLSYAHPVLSGSDDTRLKLRLRCAIDELNAASPFLPGETLIQDRFAFLTRDWDVFPAGTVFVDRQTSQARLLYAFRNVVVDAQSGDLRFDSPAAATLSAEELGLHHVAGITVLAAATLPQSIAVDVAKKLADQMAKDALKGITGNLTQLAGGVIAGAIAGAIINTILDALFPSDKKSTVDAYFEGMQKLMQQELKQQTIDEIAGTFVSLRNEMTNVYAPARLQSDLSVQQDRKNLFDYHLHDYSNTFFQGTNGMLGTLMDEKHQLACFPVFLLGAGMHLAILQEIANVDPTNTDEKFDPLKSSYGVPKTGSVAKYAKQYADHADDVWKKIREKRKSRVKYGVETWAVFRHWYHKGYYTDEAIDPDKHLNLIKYEYTNDKDGNPIPVPGKSEADVKAAMAKYQEKVLQELEDGLPDRTSIVSGWRGLIDQPLNTNTGS